MEKSIIIIGGGLTGLSAGCYGQMNGYRTTVFEMHDIAGGVATAWKRKGYTVDGAMNWLVGTRPGAPYYNIFEQLGAAKEWKIHNHELYSVDEDGHGHSFKTYCDADRFEDYLLSIAPEDEGPIREWMEAIRVLSQGDMPVEKPVELYDATELAAMSAETPASRVMQQWGAVTGTEFATRLKNPFLQAVFSKMAGMPLGLFTWVLALQHSKSAGYVLGGALALVRPIEKRYRDLGGEIHFKSKVEKILVENDKAVGVRLADGSEHRADWIVAAADGHSVIFDMLGGKYVDDTIKNMYARPNIFQPLVYIGLGVNRAFDDVPSSISGTRFPLKKPVTIAGREEHSMNILVYGWDLSLAPPGKNLAVVAYGSDYDYWEKLYQDPESYRAEKERLYTDVLAGLEERFPGISSQVEMHDVATPMTWVRYTGNWRGSYEGWMFGAHNGYIKKTLPGLAGLYLAGQWVNPGGGMCTAVASGSHTIRFICNDDGKPYTATKP
jgi:phytoene dehydrogenase-like protein